MAAVTLTNPSSYYYVPIWNELSGSRQLITGLFQKQCASMQKQAFGKCHPRAFAIKQMNREANENIEEGVEKLKTSVIIIGILVLAYF